ncbi:MAG: imidazoleglycerol-phosphate dehydratase HisB [Oscillospiraceae bacterium]|jgi:imidazoleglycerol-phosphate dehydratase|nr:imidazoleglycerol-phosphate dehydratase HisB [Oscillospiraceae bacterium]
MTRKTKETDITVELSLNGGGIGADTGVGFFDHMLTTMAFHAGWGLAVRADGDLGVDAHHTVEDVGIVLGQVLREALPENRARFGHAFVPMDEALGFAAADAGGRAFLRFDAAFPNRLLGGYDTALTKEFFRALCHNAMLTLHLRVEGEDAHHMTEALFKAAGAALRRACSPQAGAGAVSTKGVF